MNDQIDQFINTHPKQCLSILIFTISLLLNVPATVLGLVVYFLFIRKFKISVVSIVIFSLLMFAEIIYFNIGNIDSKSLVKFVQNSVTCNWELITLVASGKYQSSFSILAHELLTTTLYFPFFIASALGLIDSLKGPAHEEALKALQDGLHGSKPELDEQSLKKLINKLPEYKTEGTVLGVSVHSGSPVIIPDKYINQVMLVLGTTGSGKTVTLNRFYSRAIYQGYPLIIVDGKPDAENVKSVRKLAEENQRKFYGFNCENFYNYDVFSVGGHTELKDKIISLKDEWSSDYYRSIAEDYLQTTLEILLNSNTPLTFKKIVECLNYDELLTLARGTKNNEYKKRVGNLENYNRDDITGLQAHLNILINSELGKYFELSASCFSLDQVIKENAVAYFALPALRFPSFSKVLGKLVINDLKATVDRNDKKQPIFTIFDEFSIFAGEQVLNLVNMGRGKGAHAIFGTQGLADLDRVDPTFKSQILNCANTLICHRLNDQVSAETVANWIGTRDAFTVTAQLGGNKDENGLGSVRRNKEFIVHPDDIKQGLTIGEAFYVSKVEEFGWGKIRVKFF